MSFNSVAVDRASFRNTSEMARIKQFDCQLQISKLTTLLQMNVKVYAVLSLSFFCGAEFFFVPKPFAMPRFKTELKLILQSYKDTQITILQSYKDTQITILQHHILIYIFFTMQTMMRTGVLLF